MGEMLSPDYYQTRGLLAVISVTKTVRKQKTNDQPGPGRLQAGSEHIAGQT